MSDSGKVFLVGAGPGDLDLVTVKAMRLVSTCEVVVYDNLVNPLLLEKVSKDCERIDVGKQPGRHTMPQEDICKLLVEKAREGKWVLRLKGGDPFVFGRCAEEMTALDEAEVPYEIVPGITAALACAAYAGIPLTHRDCGSSIAFLTGHEDVEKESLRVDFAKFAAAGGTLCVYMGMGKIREIADKLLDGGLSEDRPAAVVSHGTLSAQRKVLTTLGSLVEEVEKAGLAAPAIIFVGNAVGLAREQDWFSDRPLFGRRIVVTRAREQASKLNRMLEKAGAEVLELPLIEVKPACNKEVVAEVLSCIASYEWVLFTSANGVREFFKLFFRAFSDIRSFGPMRIACVGAATAKEVEKFNLEVELVPEDSTAEHLAKALVDTDSLDSANVLVVTGNRNREVLVKLLEEVGRAIVDVMPLYETDYADVEKLPILDYYRTHGADAIVFTSSSTVDSFAEQEDVLTLREGARKPIHCSIGPITSESLKDNGMSVDLESPKSSLESVVETLVENLGTADA
ncbi:MAG: uroporphyrinogen-III C-methyltransferase [Verrucomicrobia bacterium]|nr:uroporphyrinogen-III C-methyltransferase [Verrucomicrobiota bacterium]MDA1047446.1 uroporphyrinogen-III C-methyltransferase [Verrucomicrobiota bacterium]